MKRIIFFPLCIPLIAAFNMCAPKRNTNSSLTYISNPGIKWVDPWLKAWELVSREVLLLAAAPVPDMIFFDTAHVYSISEVNKPGFGQDGGPLIYGKQLHWNKALHQGQLLLPDSQQIPVALMSFAGAGKDGATFFVMAAPSFWQSAGVNSKELGLEKLLTAVFLHEFMHTRQFEGFGSVIDSMGKLDFFKDVELTDDIVQDNFKSDSTYSRLFREEVELFYRASFSGSDIEAKQLTKQALSLMEERHTRYFDGDRMIYRVLDDIFLSMEGIGQYTAVAWLSHPQGGNLSLEVAIEGMRRGRNQWSQEEGLAMFLALRRLGAIYQTRYMFGSSPRYITGLLKAAIQ